VGQDPPARWVFWRGASLPELPSVLGIVLGCGAGVGNSPAPLAAGRDVPSAAVPCDACREEQTAAGVVSKNTAPAG